MRTWRPPIRSRSQYIVYNILLWFAVFGLGLTVIGSVHQYGQGWVSKRHAQDLVRSAADRYANGNLEEAQRMLVQAIGADPGISREVVERFGSDLLGMPNVMNLLKHGMGFGSLDDAPMDRARDALLLGDDAALRHALARAEATGAPEVHRWLGTQALAAGDIEEAARHFASYWAHPGRVETDSAPLTPTDETILRLFSSGRWTTVFALLRESEDLNSLSPEVRFIRGVEHELAGERDEALRVYMQVIAERPSHYLALVRLTQLRQD